MRKTTSYRRRGGMLTLVLLLIAAIAVLLFGTQRCRRRPLVRRGGARTAVIRRPLAPARARRSTRMPLVAAVVAIVAATAAATLLFGGRHGTLDTSATVPLGGALPEPVAVERSPRVDAVERALDHGQRASVRSGLRELPSVSPDERIYAEPEATEPEPLMAADEGAGVVGELVSVADGEPPAEAAPEEPVVASAMTVATPAPTPGLTWPLIAPISSLFGPAHPLGIDLAANLGTPVRAAGDGRVRAAAFNDIYGNYVVLDHPDGYTTVYAHFAVPASVRTGQSVRRGDAIGIVGDTGKSFGAHLHFEVHRYNRLVDPLVALPRIALVIAPMAYRAPEAAAPAATTTPPPVAVATANPTPPTPAAAVALVVPSATPATRPSVATTVATETPAPRLPPVVAATMQPVATAVATAVASATQSPRPVATVPPATAPPATAPPATASPATVAPVVSAPPRPMVTAAPQPTPAPRFIAPTVVPPAPAVAPESGPSPTPVLFPR